jgi:hypothetical protein
MKRSLLLFLAMVALSGAANDRFYIEDFTINPGETMTVSIMLDNEAAYTAFQTDLYLPEGLAVEQEDGDYIFDLTSRRGSDHTLSAQLRGDGSIRLLSYSLRIKPYSGNSGALVTFNVTADSHFTGSASILLKNILFTTTGGAEIPFANETCTVTNASTVQPGDVNGDNEVGISDVSALIDYLLGLGDDWFNTDAADVNGDTIVSIADVSALIDILLGID